MGGYATKSAETDDIVNCRNTGTVSGSRYVGGIVGGVLNNCHIISITNCRNSGSITGSRDYVAGIVGLVNGNAKVDSITNCINEGKINGNGGVGGICGQYVGTKIENCRNYASIFSQGIYTGGIAGIARGTVEKCYNAGGITQLAEDGCGGIVGTQSNGNSLNIQKCFNKGNVVANFETISNIGGILGRVDPNTQVSVSNCYNIGTIEVNATTFSNINGIVGAEAGNITKTNNFVLNGTYQTAPVAEEIKTAEELKNEAILPLLNADLEEAAWEFRAGENEGYPVIIGLQ